MIDDDAARPATWFRPGTDPSDTVPGAYRVDADGIVSAWLHSTWSDVPHPMINRTAWRTLPSVLFGNAFGTKVTLVAPSRGNSEVKYSAGQEHTRLLMDYAIEGRLIEPEQQNITRADVSFHNQERWTNWVSYQDRTLFDRVEGVKDFRVVHKKSGSLQAAISGGSVSLVDNSRREQLFNPNEWRLTSRSLFVFEFTDPVPIDILIRKYLLPLEVLLTSATGGRSGVSSLTATNRDWEREHIRDPSSDWVVIRLNHTVPEQPDRAHREMLHSLHDFDFARQMPLLFEAAAQHRYPLEHYGVLRGGVSAGDLADFMAAVQLCESFHRTLHPSKTKSGLDVRLHVLDQESGGIVRGLIGDKEWHMRVATLRNVVAHGVEGAEQLLQDPAPLRAGTQILLLLFEVRFLVRMGFASDRARDLAFDRGAHQRILQVIKRGHPSLKALAEKQSNHGGVR